MNTSQNIFILQCYFGAELLLELYEGLICNIIDTSMLLLLEVSNNNKVLLTDCICFFHFFLLRET